MSANFAVKSSIVALSLIIWAGGCHKPSAPEFTKQAKPVKGTKITLEQLELMFENMRSKTKWNIDGDMLWGYFFTDPNPKNLERLVDPLTRAGYRLGSIYETDDKSTYFLHVERIERHTPQTLYDRNDDLYRLAEEYGLESYDGMDVGPVINQ